MFVEANVKHAAEAVECAPVRDDGLAVEVIRPDLSGARNQNQRTRRYHNRNQKIVDAADEVFALVAPHRRGGTEDTIRRAQEKGIPVTLL